MSSLYAKDCTFVNKLDPKKLALDFRKKGGGPERSVSNNESVTLDELTMKARQDIM